MIAKHIAASACVLLNVSFAQANDESRTIYVEGGAPAAAAICAHLMGKGEKCTPEKIEAIGDQMRQNRQARKDPALPDVKSLIP